MIVYFLLPFTLIFGTYPTAHKLVKTKIAPKISVSLPQALSALPPEIIAQRYPSVRKALGVFTNADQTVDFSVNISATQWPDANLDIAKQFFKSSIYNLYDRVEWVSEGINTIRGKKYVYFEFNSMVRSGLNGQVVLRYTYTHYLIEPNRTLAFTFSCLKSLQPDWQKTAHAVMNSIHVK